MDRLIATNSVAVGSADTAPISGTPQYATSGNPATNTPATVFPAYQYNALQEELIAVINAGGITPSKSNNAQVASAIAAMIASAIPAGVVSYFAANAAPAGWLKSNGALVSRSTYSALFANIGTTFGAGDGSTTFGLPDFRGEFLRAWDDGRGVDTGRTLGSFQAGDVQAHTHNVTAERSTGSGFTATSGVNVIGEQTFATSSTGGAETRPRNIALLACIKY